MITLIGMSLVTGVAVSCIWSSAITAIFPSFSAAIAGLVGLYLGGNVAHKHVVTKNGVSEEDQSETK